MNVVSRGMRNAFRNSIRTFSIVVILGLSIGLALAMLVARAAVQDKIQSVKSSFGNTVTISPAGFNPASEANNALTTADLDKVKSLAHITNVTKSLSGRLTTEGSEMPMGRFGQEEDSNAKTNLKSSIDLNSINREGGPRIMINGQPSLPSNFSPPIQVLGTTDPGHVNGNTVTIKEGVSLDGTKDSDEALVSTDMASKNGLKVGSTFTAYGKTLTVIGIFDSGNRAGNDTILLSLPALQRLSSNGDTVSNAVATVDSVDNLSATVSAIKSTLGDDADVQSSQEQVDATIKPLESVKSISTFSLIGAVAAGSVVILLTMIMIVRERRREIGVFKAIGASNLKIMFQFVSEAITLTVLGMVAGIIIGAAGASPLTNTLVKNSTSSSQQPLKGESGPQMGFARGPGGSTTFRNFGNNTLTNARDVKASVGWNVLGYGVLTAFAIAIIGSAIPALLISKIRPAEVMRAE